jgi:hypothetical protein
MVSWRGNRLQQICKRGALSSIPVNELLLRHIQITHANYLHARKAVTKSSYCGNHNKVLSKQILQACNVMCRKYTVFHESEMKILNMSG